MNELSTKEMQEYLFHVRDLEVSCYKQREYIKNLETLYKQEIPELLPALQISVPSLWWDITFSVGAFAPIGAFLGGIVGIIASIFKGCRASVFGHDFDFILGFFIIVLICIVAGTAIGGVIGIAEGIHDHSKEKVENQEKQIKNQEISERNKQITNESDTRAKMISEEIAKAKRTLTETSVLLNNYYSSGVVYPKYQGLIPVTMFCEYLASGRCDTLTGHEGAYNIYENEIRLNLIIVKLEEVVDKLDQIQQNQYMLASQLEQITRELQGLNSAVATQTAVLERIDDNTEVSNYYNRITAANTDFLTWAKTYEIIRSK